MQHLLHSLTYLILFTFVVIASAWLIMFLFAPGDGMGWRSVAYACIGALAGGYICARLRQDFIKRA